VSASDDVCRSGATDASRVRSGVLYGIGAYGLWGLIPLYFKSVAHVSALEVLAHRAAWSFLVLAVLLSLSRGWGELRRTLRNPRTALLLGLSTVLIGVNWLTFIYAVQCGQVLQASLGYFVNPLVSVLLGVAFLHERLRPYQIASIALAAAGVLVLTLLVGTLPWIAIVLAASFSLYGLLRKIMPVGGLVGVAVETCAMTPAAVAYMFYLWQTQATAATNAGTVGLLAASGVITSVPLLLFVGAARRVRLATLGILQYLTPTLQFLLAVLAFGEPFSTSQVASFACIWAAVILYTADSLRAARQDRLEVMEPD
jgi:chloramphenicol-sensitive protein RarD